MDEKLKLSEIKKAKPINKNQEEKYDACEDFNFIGHLYPTNEPAVGNKTRSKIGEVIEYVYIVFQNTKVLIVLFLSVLLDYSCTVWNIYLVRTIWLKVLNL